MPKKFKGLLTIFFVIIVIGIILFKVLNVQNIILKVLYPVKYSEYVYKYAEENSLDPELIFAVIKAESNFKPDVQSRSNAKGLMQLMDSTANEVFTKIENKFDNTASKNNSKDLFDPETNIKIGTKYLSTLLTRYDGNLYLAVIAYNAGIGTVDKWVQDGTIKKNGSDLENIPYKETKTYVQKILKNYRVYKTLYS